MTQRIVACRYCGKIFQVEKHKRAMLCSDECRRQQKNRGLRRYRRKLRQMGKIEADENFNNLAVVTVNGQQRIKAAVILEKATRKVKKNA